ncbi:hypothetical protein D3C80_2210880 [compost metagenome]
MNLQQRNHQTAVIWIEGEIEEFASHVGERNASSGANAVIDLSFLLGAISEPEHASFKERVKEIHLQHQGGAA